MYLAQPIQEIVPLNVWMNLAVLKQALNAVPIYHAISSVPAIIHVYFRKLFVRLTRIAILMEKIFKVYPMQPYFAHLTQNAISIAIILYHVQNQHFMEKIHPNLISLAMIIIPA